MPLNSIQTHVLNTSVGLDLQPPIPGAKEVSLERYKHLDLSSDVMESIARLAKEEHVSLEQISLQIDVLNSSGNTQEKLQAIHDLQIQQSTADNPIPPLSISLLVAVYQEISEVLAVNSQNSNPSSDNASKDINSNTPQVDETASLARGGVLSTEKTNAFFTASALSVMLALFSNIADEMNNNLKAQGKVFLNGITQCAAMGALTSVSIMNEGNDVAGKYKDEAQIALGSLIASCIQLVAAVGQAVMLGVGAYKLATAPSPTEVPPADSFTDSGEPINDNEALNDFGRGNNAKAYVNQKGLGKGMSPQDPQITPDQVLDADMEIGPDGKVCLKAEAIRLGDPSDPAANQAEQARADGEEMKNSSVKEAQAKWDKAQRVNKLSEVRNGNIEKWQEATENDTRQIQSKVQLALGVSNSLAQLITKSFEASLKLDEAKLALLESEEKGLQALYEAASSSIKKAMDTAVAAMNSNVDIYKNIIEAVTENIKSTRTSIQQATRF